MTNLCRNTDDTERLVNIALLLIVKSVVLNFSRAITHDEEAYPNPDVFQPERFFNADGTLNDDTVVYAFGFGRRYVEFTYDRRNANMICSTVQDLSRQARG